LNLHDLTNRIAALAVQVDMQLPARLHAMRDAMTGLPGAQHFGPVRAGRSVLWCDVHERDVRECEDHDLDCDGETIRVNDPTGEAAVNGDPAKADLRQLERRLLAAFKALDEAVAIGYRYPTAEEARTKLVVDRAGIGTCARCPKYCDGEKANRLSAYKDTGDLVCPACRARLDRAFSAARLCASELTRLPDVYRCTLQQGHDGEHRWLTKASA
jgi:hypothetical protein